MEDNKNLNPLDTQVPQDKDESQLLDSIVNTKTNQEVEENLLNIAPDVDVSLLQDMTPQKSIHLLLLKIIFSLLMVTGLISVTFFSVQLTHSFDFLNSTFDIPSVIVDLEDTNADVLSLQTDLNLYRYLQINSYLNEVSYYGDAFVQSYEIQNSQTATDKDKKDAKNTMTSVKKSIADAFLSAADLIGKDFYVPLIDPMLVETDALVNAFELELKSKLVNKSNELNANSGEDNYLDYKNYVQAMNIVGNSTLRALFVSTDIEAISDQELYSIIKVINKLVVNDLSIIQEIKNSRVKWSDIMNEIDLRTIEVDSSYSEHYYDLKGGIRYSSYDFDKDANRIAISGEIMRYDTANFSMIANLIDEFNRSEIFEGAEMRSLSKSGSNEDGYKSSVRLNLGLRSPSDILK